MNYIIAFMAFVWAGTLALRIRTNSQPLHKQPLARSNILILEYGIARYSLKMVIVKCVTKFPEVAMTTSNP